MKIRIRGEAEASAIAAKAKAESEQMAKKAEAWREYREAAMVDMLLDTLPKVNTLQCVCHSAHSIQFRFRWIFLIFNFGF